MSKLFLFDIEGTTTDINFVHKILFPYSKEKMAQFLYDNSTNKEVLDICDEVKKMAQEEDGQTLASLDDVSNKLISWIEDDRKVGPLKTIQGLIWDYGYKNGDFKGHVYDDVKPFFEEIKAQGHTIGIYSSGSVHAQKLIFGYSTAGDLNPYISFYFDTKVGAKREVTSYQNILNETKFEKENVVFFSDIPQELAAAQAAGITPVQLLRPGTESSDFFGITDFQKFDL